MGARGGAEVEFFGGVAVVFVAAVVEVAVGVAAFGVADVGAVKDGFFGKHFGRFFGLDSEDRTEGFEGSVPAVGGAVFVFGDEAVVIGGLRRKPES